MLDADYEVWYLAQRMSKTPTFVEQEQKDRDVELEASQGKASF